ncbi:MAG: hypothetical protein ACREU2_12415, partial [Steroidobacteraceae bacterium]
MLSLSAELIEHIGRGGTVIVPSRQRAAALRLAHSAAMLEAGKSIWASPDILPWNAWIERGLSEARVRAQALPRRLSILDDWLLWRAAVCEAAAGREILAPEQLTNRVRRAMELLDEYGVTLPDDSCPEVALLRSARRHYRRRCREQGVASQSWGDCCGFVQPSADVLLAGFEGIGPARRRWLEGHGVALYGTAAAATRGEVLMAGYPDAAQEAEAAAEWCAQWLMRDPRARMLLVVPRLDEQRHLWQRALSQRLDYGRILGSEEAADGTASAYAIEGGQSLASYPLVAAALNLVTFVAGEAQFDQLSGLLRSPYLSASDRAARLQLDVWLREQNIDAAAPAALAALNAAVTTGAGAAPAAMLASLLEAAAALQALGGRDAGRSPAAPRAVWARGIAALLARCGWPGPGSLDSEQQQVRMRFDELLGELAAAGAAPLSLESMDALLRELAADIAFEPATDDVAVTVTGNLADPIVRYDGIWVAGLSADAWPPAVRPDSLIPLGLQRSAGMPGV